MLGKQKSQEKQTILLVKQNTHSDRLSYKVGSSEKQEKSVLIIFKRCFHNMHNMYAYI